MQGRLSPIVNGRIQAFPWAGWQEEFRIAQELGFGLMEWTLDHEERYANPLLNPEGQFQIRMLCKTREMKILSLTGDCFMQNPFWKAQDEESKSLISDFRTIVEGCANVGIQMIVMPLVDNGRLENQAQENALVNILKEEATLLSKLNIKVIFESDFGPMQLAQFIARFDPMLFGINYDIGNSASMGFDPAKEIAAYGDRILNVHVKDRLRAGTTVPLGTGNADFDAVFNALSRAGYVGKYILQTARAADGQHADVLCRYRDMTSTWLRRYGV